MVLLFVCFCYIHNVYFVKTQRQRSKAEFSFGNIYDWLLFIGWKFYWQEFALI